MLFNSIEKTSLAPLAWIFPQHGISWDEIAQTILEYVLPWSADLYFQIELEVQQPPLDIASWFVPDISEAQMRERVQRFCDRPQCCCDEGASCKVESVFFCKGKPCRRNLVAPNIISLIS